MATIDDANQVEVAEIVAEILNKAGIEPFIEGSVVIGVDVRKGDAQNAIVALRNSISLKGRGIQILEQKMRKDAENPR